MKSFKVAVIATIIIFLVGVGFQLSGYDWKVPNVEVKVTESLSVKEAKILDLTRMRYEYPFLTEESKAEMRMLINMVYADFDPIDVHGDLKEFLKQVRNYK